MSKTISISSFENVNGLNGTFDEQIAIQNNLLVKNYSVNSDPNSTVQRGIYEFIYAFPQGATVFEEGTEIAFNFISLWNSYYNITGRDRGNYQNNTFSYLWPNGATTDDITVTIPSGYYTYTTLNTWFQSWMIDQGHYLIDGSGNYVFYMEFIYNPTYYVMQLITYAVPDVTTYTQPLNATWALPTAPLSPQVYFKPIYNGQVSNFANLIGFDSSDTTSYGGDTVDVIHSALRTPVFQQISHVNLLCNLLYNPLKIPSSILYTFSLSGTCPGSLLTEEPSSSLVFLPVKPGQYISIVFTLVDQQYRNIALQDPNVIITCTIRKRPKLLD